MKRVQFEHSPIPYLFIAPQIIIIVVFFLWPAAQAIYQSFLLEDPFGLSSQFVGLGNFEFLRKRERRPLTELPDA